MAFPMDELDSAARPDAADAGPALLGDIVLCPASPRTRPDRRAQPAGRVAPAHRARRAAPARYDHAEPAEERECSRCRRILADFRTLGSTPPAGRAARCRQRLLSAVGSTTVPGIFAPGPTLPCQPSDLPRINVPERPASAQPERRLASTPAVQASRIGRMVPATG